MNYIKLIKENFDFLKGYGYKIEDEENSVLWKYVRYVNSEKKRLISISFDLRENHVKTTLWHLTEEGNVSDADSYELGELLSVKNIHKQLIPLPENSIKDLTEEAANQILFQRASILKEHFLEIVKGTNWVELTSL